MSQLQLPYFPAGVTPITAMLAFAADEGRVTYFNSTMPVFVHGQDDLASFRMITAQFCVNGNAKQSEIARAFGIPKITIKRAVQLYREAGPKGFYQTKRTRGAAVLTAAVLAQAQQWLDEGLETGVVADRLGIKRDTLSKAVRAGRLAVRAKKKSRLS
jgi:transposase